MFVRNSQGEYTQPVKRFLRFNPRILYSNIVQRFFEYYTAWSSKKDNRPNYRHLSQSDTSPMFPDPRNRGTLEPVTHYTSRIHACKQTLSKFGTNTFSEPENNLVQNQLILHSNRHQEKRLSNQFATSEALTLHE